MPSEEWETKSQGTVYSAAPFPVKKIKKKQLKKTTKAQLEKKADRAAAYQEKVESRLSKKEHKKAFKQKWKGIY